MYTYIYIYVSIHIYNIYIYTHTYIHTYIHTYKYMYTHRVQNEKGQYSKSNEARGNMPLRFKGCFDNLACKNEASLGLRSDSNQGVYPKPKP